MKKQMSNKAEKQFLRRGINHLGFMEAKLRDLRGFATLAHELIQNADDAHDATTIVFDVREDALVVDNNGVFSDCGSVGSLDEEPCQWKQDPMKSHYCDFHRFQDIASADKRIEEGTTGAFGIGFIAVYQITDHPELISNNRHWVLREEASENERIEVCQGCSRCKGKSLPGTRFILPWALDKKSPIRKALRAETVTPIMRDEFLTELKKSLPVAMIFLKKITCIEIKKDGKLIKRLNRFPDEGNIIISDGNPPNDVRWTILEGDFENEAIKLRDLNEGMIEEKRSHTVKIAIPDRLIANGLLCACLPTELSTGLPFHINADFFTSSDRKKIILANDYQSDWNRAAIKGASDTLARSFNVLPQLCGHEYLWELIVSVFGVSQEAKKAGRDKAFLCFWDNLHPVLRETPVIFTESESWMKPTEAFLLGSESEESAQPVFDMLDIDIVHRDIRSLVHRVRYAEDLKIRRLELDHFIAALHSKGFSKKIEIEEQPDLIKNDRGLIYLYDEILHLYNRQQNKEKRRELDMKLQNCAIIMGRDQALRPIREVFFADEQTVSLFDNFDDTLPFVNDLGDAYKQILQLCPQFTLADALRYLKAMFTKPSPPCVPRELSPKLLEWFEARKEGLRTAPKLKSDLVSLPFFPDADGLHPLTSLALPGEFEDPIGFSNFVDLKLLGGRRDFLLFLGAAPLTLSAYVRDHVPRAFKNNTIAVEKKQLLVKLLSLELAKIRDDEYILSELRTLPIVECNDHEFRQPLQVYFPEEIVKKVLGNNIHCVLLSEENKSAVTEFYEWLGVAKRPRSIDIIKYLKQLVSEPPKEASIKKISEICRYFGDKYKNEKEQDPTIETLNTIPWLPAKGNDDRWHRPSELFTVFREYLFASQAHFLNLPLPIQQSATDFFKLIGLKDEPTPELVVKHLLFCAEQGTDVNKEVYSYLTDRITDQLLLRLHGKPCLNLGEGRYVSPEKVFWSAHPFGRFRNQLSTEMRKYSDFLSKLGVREAAQSKDAIAVLQEIATEYGSVGKPLDEQTNSVCFTCWKMLTEGLAEDIISQQQIHHFAEKIRIIPDQRSLLNLPAHIFFEDRAGVGARFGDFLKHNTIPRTQGAWLAMAAAGVRALSEVIDIKLLECIDPISDDEMKSTIASRKHQINRVLEPHKEIISNPEVIETLTFDQATDLKIQYVFSGFGTSKVSEPENVPTYYDKDDCLLYYVRRNGNTPWTSIAREIALAIAPDADPGLLASGLKDVLSADSPDGAQLILDELGYAPLDVVDDKPINGETVKELGTEGVPGTIIMSAFEGEKNDESGKIHTGKGASPVVDKSGPGDEKQGQSGKDKPQPPEEAKAEPSPTPTTDEALKNIFGEKGVPPQESGGDHGVGSTEDGKSGKAPGDAAKKDDGPSKKKQKRKNILRTIVYPEGASTEEDVESDTSNQRNEVDEAGIKHVVNYEESKGRFPKVMPHHHPGYDIEANDKWGDIVRYIEVKSLSEKWKIGNAVLSKTQFEKASELGEQYWLYVVERAQAEDACLHCIQNPANRVDQFVYDDGWMALSMK